MGVWDNIDNPSIDQGGGLKLPYMKPGKHLLRVRKIAQYESTKNRGQQWFRAEFDVLEGPNYGDVPACSWIVKLSLGDVALRDVKRFVEALLGAGTTVNGESMDDLCGPEQPATGLTVRCEAVNTTTQKGGDFTQVSWSPDGK